DRVPSLGRDRGHDHRGPRRRDRHRADQDRRPVAIRAGGEVQPAAPDRRGAGRRRRVPRVSRALRGVAPLVTSMAAARPRRVVDRGAITAAWVGVGMAVTIGVSFLLVIPIEPIYWYL